MKETTRTHQPIQSPDRARLFDISSEQGGYFTADQARICGYSRALLSHHAKSGRFIRVRRGLYRFREYPSSPREDVLVAWLVVGRDVAVVSHESALDILGLSDIIPDAVHVTVPRFRRNLPSLPGARIHTTARPLGKEDLLTRDGMAVTSATRSILDAAETGTAPEQIEMAVAQAIDRGLATAQELQRGASDRGRRLAKQIEDALQKVKQ
ncbi:MAG: type IV toxin-antitoxin system AbiEi family antitoxin domain-containing protein [Dehalococcoidia bacterium]|nr:type IV toxin-antitoxin system AbiEi family antitoxin domain-containing protein [Dehalococcoidia bacterium]